MSQKLFKNVTLAVAAALLATLSFVSGCSKEESPKITPAQAANGVTPQYLKQIKTQENKQKEILKRHAAARKQYDQTKRAEDKAKVIALEKEYETAQEETRAIVRERLRRAAGEK